MSDLRELYQEVILDHNKSPRNFRKLDDANRHAEGFNPLCGDHYDVYLKMKDGVIEEVSFEGAGCAISKAAASLMTSAVKGKTREEAEAIFSEYQKMVTGSADTLAGNSLGRLLVFSEVCNYPTRIKCAVLPWHTLRSALEGEDEVVSTE